jgi:SAM-dependent methyltransferase
VHPGSAVLVSRLILRQNRFSMTSVPDEERQAFWDSHYRRTSPHKVDADDWVLKHLSGGSTTRRVLELGCGLGPVSEMLHSSGYRVTATDIAPEALARLSRRVPELPTLVLDLQVPLPFPPDFFDVVIADLCLHYFDSPTTQRIVDELQRVLTPSGVLLARVNSNEDYAHGAGSGQRIEDKFLLHDGDYKRFFDEAMIR